MQDKTLMRECFKLARASTGSVAPNPFVGAVLVDATGKIIARGAHLKYGEAHAEANCINDYLAHNSGDDGNFSNLTLYVNLEPCSHHGKTPPCTDLIIGCGLRKVVIAMLDPNPKVSGRGVKALRNAGIDVSVGVLEDEARALNRVFIKNITTGKPYVAIKTATTLDGKIATPSGSSKWITSEKARNRVKELRGEFDALLSGSGTVLADNPTFKGAKKIIIMDRSGKIAPHHDWILVRDFQNFDKLFKELYKQGIYSVLVEAGSGLNSAIIEAGEADFLYQFIAPKIAGRGLGFADGLEISDINLAQKLKNVKITKFPPDILLTCGFD